MKFSNAPPQHLSNLEVLHHFLALKQSNDALHSALAQRKARKKQAAEELYPPDKNAWRGREDTPVELTEWSEEKDKEEEIAERRGGCDELVWVQDKVIHYLCSDHTPTARQTDEGVALLADQLQDHGLTKAEVLQLCNLAPTLPVELYCIIEEVDLRFLPDPTEKLESIASQIHSTLLPEPPAHLAPFVTHTRTEHGAEEMTPDAADKVGGWDREGAEEAGVAMGMGMGLEEEYVHEAEWGRDREEAVDEEGGGDMD